jgi:hypothetical protein
MGGSDEWRFGQGETIRARTRFGLDWAGWWSGKWLVRLFFFYGIFFLKVGSLDGYYRFTLGQHRKKRMIDEDYDALEANLGNHPQTLWVQRQALLSRQKRDYTADNIEFAPPSDPLWKASYYLSRNIYDKSLPDMNVTGAWRQGYTGSGVTVTFLDDGFERDHPDLQQNYVRSYFAFFIFPSAHIDSHRFGP